MLNKCIKLLFSPAFFLVWETYTHHMFNIYHNPLFRLVFLSNLCEANSYPPSWFPTFSNQKNNNWCPTKVRVTHHFGCPNVFFGANFWCLNFWSHSPAKWLEYWFLPKKNPLKLVVLSHVHIARMKKILHDQHHFRQKLEHKTGTNHYFFVCVWCDVRGNTQLRSSCSIPGQPISGQPNLNSVTWSFPTVNESNVISGVFFLKPTPHICRKIVLHYSNFYTYQK